MHHKLTFSIGLTFALAAPFLLAGNDYTGDWAKVNEILASIEEPDIPENDYLITDYGAVGDGETDSLPAIRKAIFEAGQRGGGRIIVPEGAWYVDGPIHLKSGINLHVSKGAQIVFSEDPEDYLPAVLTRWEGTVCYNYSPLIYAANATDVAITGEGVLNGNAKNGFGLWRPRQEAAQNLLRQMGNDLYPVQDRVFGKGHYLRPPFIQFFNCKNVLVEDITIHESPFWCIHPVFCYNVTVRGVTVESFRLNNDGVDPDSSVNVLIENCTFRTGDDAVSLKSGRDQDGWRIGQPTKNVIVRNCEMPEVHNGLAIGSDMSGGVENVFMENCTIGTGRSCLLFKSNLDRGGYIRHVRLRNVHVGVAREAFIEFTTNYHSWRGNHFPPEYRDFVIENVSCEQADRYGIYAIGKKDSPLHDIHLKNVTIGKAEIPQYVSLVENLRYEEVTINGKPAAPETLDSGKLGDYEEERRRRHEGPSGDDG